MNTYTVILLYPDYAWPGGNIETFKAVVKDKSPEEAYEQAQKMASRVNGGDYPADDFDPLLVFEGDVSDKLIWAKIP